jgi:tetratricopeptide (TPR) repeat protein
MSRIERRALAPVFKLTHYRESRIQAVIVQAHAGPETQGKPGTQRSPAQNHLPKRAPKPLTGPPLTRPPLTGRLREVARQYQQILERDPGHAEALAAMSLVALASRQPDAALAMAQAAVAAAPNASAIWVVLGQALRAAKRNENGQDTTGQDATGRAEAARRAYETALKLDARNALAHTGLGELKIAAGRPEEALADFEAALSLDASLLAARMGQGHALACLDRFAEALLRYEEALARNPRLPEAEFASGFALTRLGRPQEAERRYRRAIALRPDFAAAWMNLGCLFREQGRELYAEAALRRAVELRPELIAGWINLALLKREMGRRNETQIDEAQMAEAEACLKRAEALGPERVETQIAWVQFYVARRESESAWKWLQKAQAREPENPEAANMHGILLHNEGRFTEAVAAFERAEALGSTQAASNRGNSLLELGHAHEALAAHARAAELDPNNPGTRYNLALTQLRMGKWSEGWRNYEARWSFREVHRQPRRFNRPRWQGERLSGERVLLHAEQGLGDTIQFCRYAALVAARGGFPILQVQGPVERLLGSLEIVREGRAAVTRLDAPRPDFDLESPLLNLPQVFETKVETVPLGGAYLSPHLDSHWAADAADPETRPMPFPDGDCGYPRVGLAWAGNPRYKADARRSTTLDTLLPLVETPGIDWVSLQKGEAAGQLAQLAPEIRIVDGAAADRDLADTAAQISRLDLVVTTDTSIAHLAGAMGKPVWIMLPALSDWRWMQEIETTPWYPTARLIRQQRPGDWDGVIARVLSGLAVMR